MSICAQCGNDCGAWYKLSTGGNGSVFNCKCGCKVHKITKDAANEAVKIVGEVALKHFGI